MAIFFYKPYLPSVYLQTKLAPCAPMNILVVNYLKITDLQ